MEYRGQAAGHSRRGSRTTTMEGIRGPLAFAMTAAIVSIYAVNEGGFDIIFRQEAGLALAWALAVGYVLGVLPLSDPPRSASRPLAALVALLAWTVLSLLWTDSTERTTEEVARIVHYAALLALAWSVLGRRTWRSAAAGLTAAGLAVSVLSVVARLSPATFDATSSEVFNTDRLAFPFGYWNAVGAWGAMSICLGLAWSVHASGKGTRAAALAATPVAASAVYLSYSRAGAAAAIFGVLLLLALDPRRDRLAVNAGVVAATTAVSILVIRSFPEIANGTGDSGAGWVALVLVAAGAVCARVAMRRRKRRTTIEIAPETLRRVAAVAAVVVVALVAALGPQAATSLTSSFAGRAPDPREDPANRFTGLGGDRHELWASSVEAFADSPVTGIGPGTFQFWWTQDTDHDSEVMDAHSLYLETLGELGLPGFLLICAFVVTMGIAIAASRAGAGRDSDRGLIGGLGAAFAVFALVAAADWMWEMTAVAIFALIAGAIAISASSSRATIHISRGAKIAVATLAIAGGVAQIPGLVATDRERASAALVLDDPERALELADDAIDAEPWAATPYVRRSFANEVLGNEDDARADILEAESREPTNWRHPLRRARLEFELGNQTASQEAFDRARELEPLIPPDREAVLQAISSE